MTKKLIIIISVVAIVLIAILYQTVFKQEELAFDLVEVIRGDVHQEVLETGMVTKGGKVDLGFKNSGTIEEIYVSVGDVVEQGEVLAELDNDQLQIQLNETRASLASSQAQLNKLLAGSTTEEIAAAQTTVANAETALTNAEKNLEDVELKAEENLDDAYEDALNLLGDAYLKIYNSFNLVDSILETYFSKETQESNIIEKRVNDIRVNMNQSKSYLDTAKSNSTNENIDNALLEMRIVLDSTFDDLTTIREISEFPLYHNPVSSTDKSSLDAHRGYINTALTNVVNSQQTISGTKITNTTNINTAQTSVDTVQGTLKSAQDSLALLLAKPRQEDIDLYQSQVDQVKARVQLLENQIQDTILRSPTSGQITEINKEKGETTQPASQSAVISLLPLTPFQIEVDIYEEDVVKVNIGNSVDISLVAFPDQFFKGELIIISPVEKLVDGVVYYEVKIEFKEIPENIKPGMTADLTINTLSKENVLVIPVDAVIEKEDKKIVEVFKDGSIEEREVVTGLEDNDDMVEVISGLEEGENVIIQ